MKLFDQLSETKIKEWLKKKQEPGYVAPPSPEKTELGQPMQSYLLDEIIALIKHASTEDEAQRKATIKKIVSLEIQLLASLERDGYNMMAQQMEKTITKAKAQYLWNNR